MARPSDRDFFWEHHRTIEAVANGIEYYVDQAYARDSEEFTEEERETVLSEARNLQRVTEEIIKRLTMPGNYPKPGKRVVRFKRRRDGTVILKDGTEICPTCGEKTSPGQMTLHRRIEHRLEDWWKTGEEQ